MKFKDIIIGIPREIMSGEKRVSATPETIMKFINEGAKVLVEKGAGMEAFYNDSEYSEAGAKILPGAKEIFGNSDVILKVKEPGFNKKEGKHEIDMMKDNSILVTFLHPANRTNHMMVQKLAERGITGFTLDSIPRISRAQHMDALTSMSTMAGYRSVISGAYNLRRIVPMIATSSCTIGPSNALVVGAGVAGLQAVATAKRLGARVKTIDIRPEACEQAKSLGAEVIPFEVPGELSIGDGGYAKRLPEKWYELERKTITPHLIESDLVILSALIPRELAPILVSKSMVEGMKKGSVIIDISIDQGGNCELTREGEEYDYNGVFISGIKNIPAYLTIDSTKMFAENVWNFLNLIFEEGKINLNMDDEIISKSIVTKDNKIIHEETLKAIRNSTK